MTNREKLIEYAEGIDIGIPTADGFDEALIGAWSARAVYDRDKCIEILARDMSQEEAAEYFCHNVEGAYIGNQTPLFITLFKE